MKNLLTAQHLQQHVKMLLDAHKNNLFTMTKDMCHFGFHFAHHKETPSTVRRQGDRCSDETALCLMFAGQSVCHAEVSGPAGFPP